MTSKLATAKLWALLLASAWGLVWFYYAAAYIVQGKVEVLLILGVFSIPVSLLVNEISHSVVAVIGATQEIKLHMDLGLLLVFGCLQYGAVGYVFGRILNSVYSAYVGKRTA